MRGFKKSTENTELKKDPTSVCGMCKEQHPKEEILYDCCRKCWTVRSWAAQDLITDLSISKEERDMALQVILNAKENKEFHKMVTSVQEHFLFLFSRKIEFIAG